MIDDNLKLVVCVAASLAAHLVLRSALEHLPPREEPKPPPVVTVRVEPKPVRAAPEPEPEKRPEPLKPPEPPKQPLERPKVRVAAAAHAATPHVATLDPRATTEGPTTDTPVFGVTMESTSSAGSGPSMPVGNTSRPEVGTAPGNAGATKLAAPVAAFEATVMPTPQGRCSGTYTDDARKAGVEGTVVLDLVVGADGRARDIHVVSGLPHGLTEAAVTALRGCRFTPGQKDGTTVAVAVRGFKIRFVLESAP